MLPPQVSDALIAYCQSKPRERELRGFSKFLAFFSPQKKEPPLIEKLLEIQSSKETLESWEFFDAVSDLLFLNPPKTNDLTYDVFIALLKSLRPNDRGSSFALSNFSLEELQLFKRLITRPHAENIMWPSTLIHKIQFASEKERVWQQIEFDFPDIQKIQDFLQDNGKKELSEKLLMNKEGFPATLGIWNCLKSLKEFPLHAFKLTTFLSEENLPHYLTVLELFKEKKLLNDENINRLFHPEVISRMPQVLEEIKQHPNPLSGYELEKRLLFTISEGWVTSNWIPLLFRARLLSPTNFNKIGAIKTDKQSGVFETLKILTLFNLLTQKNLDRLMEKMEKGAELTALTRGFYDTTEGGGVAFIFGKGVVFEEGKVIFDQDLFDRLMIMADEKKGFTVEAVKDFFKGRKETAAPRPAAPR